MTPIEERINALASNLVKTRDQLQTEEATKNALIMPFIANVLGYNVFDPSEVIPEFTADFSIKKGEKVDYAIQTNGAIQMLIECKKYGHPLSYDNAGQLARYFQVTQAKIGLLTNGQIYEFYTDLEAPNIMDKKPFLKLDLDNIDDRLLPEIEKLTKSEFDLNSILASAETLKYVAAVRAYLAAQFESPDQDFIRLILKSTISGSPITMKLIERLTPAVTLGMSRFISDRVASRLKAALSSNDENDPKIKTEPEEAVDGENGRKVETTQEEIDGFNIVRAICSAEMDVERIAMRDGQRYCAILLDDNNRRPIVRLHFNSSRKRIELFDADSSEFAYVDTPSCLYQYADRILAAARKYS